MSTHEMATQSGEETLGKEVTNVYQLIALVLAKYGMIGIVVAYFGFINWEQHKQLVALTEKATQAAEEQTDAVNALTNTLQRLDIKPK